jgi:hypothetical protein
MAVPDGPNAAAAVSGSGHRTRRTTFVAVWAAAWTVLLGLLFTGTTALTVGLWATDPTFVHTNPVLDLAFFALGAILITAGLASQVAGDDVAGLQQAVVALLSLAAAGWLGARIEPLVGAVTLLAVAGPVAALHPRRRQLLAAGEGVSGPLMAFALTVAVPAIAYAAVMLAAARAAGPSCFLGQCVRGDRLAEAAALGIAVALVALLASLRTAGWSLPAWCAGLAAIVLGGASLAFQGEQGSLTKWLAAACVAWGVGFVATALGVAHRARTKSCSTSGVAAPPPPEGGSGRDRRGPRAARSG